MITIRFCISALIMPWIYLIHYHSEIEKWDLVWSRVSRHQVMRFLLCSVGCQSGDWWSLQTQCWRGLLTSRHSLPDGSSRRKVLWSSSCTTTLAQVHWLMSELILISQYLCPFVIQDLLCEYILWNIAFVIVHEWAVGIFRLYGYVVILLLTLYQSSKGWFG